MKAGMTAEEFVNEEVPQAVRRLFPSALRRAYAGADELIERSAPFQTPGGRYQRGDLVMLFASYELELLVKAGSIPFDGEWEYFARPTGKHFVMLTRHARITTSQVDDPKKKPRRAVFRANYGEMNETSMFPDMNVAVEPDDRRLLHLLHGYQSLDFAYLTYPHPERNRHVYRTGNLMRLPHEITTDLPAAEGPAESPSPEAVENVERHLHDTDD